MSIACNSWDIRDLCTESETGGNSQNHHHYSAPLEILANMLSKKKKTKNPKKAKQKIKFVIVYGMIILKPQRKIIKT